MTPITIRLKPSKLKERAQIVNDGIPGILLLFAGLNFLVSQGWTESFMPYVNILVGAIVVRTAIAQLKHEDNANHINWFDVSGGLLILVEAYSQYKPYKSFQPAHLYALAGIITIARGFLAERMPRIRRVMLNEELLFARTSPFRALTVEWSKVVRIDRNSSALVFKLQSRIVRLNLKKFENGSEVIQAVVDVAGERGIAITRIDE